MNNPILSGPLRASLEEFAQCFQGEILYFVGRNSHHYWTLYAKDDALEGYLALAFPGASDAWLTVRNDCNAKDKFSLRLTVKYGTGPAHNTQRDEDLRMLDQMKDRHYLLEIILGMVHHLRVYLG